MVQDSYLPYLQKTWAEPNGIDLVLILPAEDIAAFRKKPLSMICHAARTSGSLSLQHMNPKL